MNAALPAPAGFWKRYVAYFIDIVIVYAALELLMALLLPGAGRDELAQLQAMTVSARSGALTPGDALAALTPVLAQLQQQLLWSSAGYVVLAGAYFAAMESSPWQATVGKRLLGLHVTDTAGGRIGPGRALARFVAAGLSWLTMNLGHALAAWTPERRALHDYVAGTRVVLADPAHARMPAWGWAIIGLHAALFLAMLVAVVALVAYALVALSAI